MKKLIMLLALVSFASCMTKDDIATKQPNGLNYTFIDYIGPDSCKLYKCAYHEEGRTSADDVFLTVCKDKSAGTNYSYTSGKQTIHVSNNMVYESVPEYDTIINMVPKYDTIIRKKIK